MTDQSQVSRYQRVVAILDAANNGSCASYDGKGQFWQDYDLLMTVEIYGVRMIAPPPSGPSPEWYEKEDSDSKKSCGSCHDEPSQRTPGRGAASGLIVALKGSYPFDGTHFPPFMWGGRRVSVPDIDFIANWIDDGCPKEDSADEATATACKKAARASGSEEYPVFSGPINHHKAQANEVLQRKNVAYLTEQELADLRYAFGRLQWLNKNPADNRSWNAWAQIHGDTCQHGWEQFLPWHRIYLYEFELALQDLIPGLALPYWDWTMPQYDQGKTGIVPEAYRCWMTEDGLKALEGTVPADVLQLFHPILNEKFNSWQEMITKTTDPNKLQEYKAPIKEELVKINPMWHPYRYPMHNAKLLADTFHHHYPRKEDIEQIMQVNNWRDFGGGPTANQSFGYLSMNPHNTGHIWSGGINPYYDSKNPNDPLEPQFGDMFLDLRAAFDPIFWGHHSNVDRLFTKWQELHPGLNPPDGSDVLLPFSYTVSQSLDVHKFGYEYVAHAAVVKVDKGTSISKFKSGAISVPIDLAKNHEAAELRLHKVVPPEYSFYIRAFLNQPDADISTPLDGNDHFVANLPMWGHGRCVGEAGHCDSRPEIPRKYDMRPRHHNTPRNYRLNLGPAIKRLAAKGAKDFTVHLVLVGADGKEIRDALKLESVSINIMDH